MKVVYVAGAFRYPSVYVPGHQDHWGIQQNIMRAMTCSLDIWRAGAAALCPHANTMFFQNAAPDDVWLEGDLELMRRCDAVYMVPGWEQSKGACAEYAEAKAIGLPIFCTFSMLYLWLHPESGAVPEASGDSAR